MGEEGHGRWLERKTPHRRHAKGLVSPHKRLELLALLESLDNQVGEQPVQPSLAWRADGDCDGPSPDFLPRF